MALPNPDIICETEILGYLAQVEGDPDTAARSYEESLALRREAGDRAGMVSTLNNLGAMAHLQGQLDEAARHYREGLRIHQELGNRLAIATLLHNLGEVAEQSSDHPRAVTLLHAARRIFEDLKSPYQAETEVILARVAAAIGRSELDDLLEAAEAMTEEEIIAAALGEG